MKARSTIERVRAAKPVTIGRCPVCGSTVDFDPALFMDGHNVCWGGGDYWTADHHAPFEQIEVPLSLTAPLPSFRRPSEDETDGA